MPRSLTPFSITALAVGEAGTQMAPAPDAALPALAPSLAQNTGAPAFSRRLGRGKLGLASWLTSQPAPPEPFTEPGATVTRSGTRVVGASKASRMRSYLMPVW